MPATITVSDLRKSYGDVVAVDGVSFEVSEGEFFGILGPNVPLGRHLDSLYCSGGIWAVLPVSSESPGS